LLLNNPFQLRNCFDVIYDCRKGKTALLCASSDAENPDVIAALLSVGADIEAKDMYTTLYE
jgi:hypothetical protein